MESQETITKSDLLKQEAERAQQQFLKLQKDMEELYDMFPKPQTDEDGYAEWKVMKLEKVIQDLQAKANERQPGTPPEIKE